MEGGREGGMETERETQRDDNAHIQRNKEMDAREERTLKRRGGAQEEGRRSRGRRVLSLVRKPKVYRDVSKEAREGGSEPVCKGAGEGVCEYAVWREYGVWGV
jgi:hypothetical protein